MDSSANYPVTIDLTDEYDTYLQSTARAVLEEYRATTRWKRLRCRSISLVGNDADTAVYVLHVSSSLEFDWTWEGAVAFRPTEMIDSEDPSDIDKLLVDNTAGNGQEDRIAWYGEVVEVDETEGEIYVSAPDSERPPCVGSFFVRPFEFLETLKTIYSDPDYSEMRRKLPGYLAACRGNQHPQVSSSSSISRPELAEVWQNGWGILWGPPGTGKTYTIGQQVALCLADPSERILVVSTTNKATDEVALKIGLAAKSEMEHKRVLRIGKSADYDRFWDKGIGYKLSIRKNCQIE